MAELEVKGLTVNFGGLMAVSELDLHVKPGEVVALIGPNGAGKSTTFNLISGVFKPTAGTVFISGEDITGLRSDLITRKGVVRTFQVANLFPYSPAIANMMTAFHLHSKSGFIRSILRTPSYNEEEKEFFLKSKEYLGLVGLSEAEIDLYNAPARSLSAGHQRLLTLAMAMAAKPEVLLLDEMMAGLSTEEIESLVYAVRHIRDTMNPAILWVEHHMKAVMSVADRVVVLNFGRKIAEGKPAEVARDPAVVEAYLGEEADVI